MYDLLLNSLRKSIEELQQRDVLLSTLSKQVKFLKNESATTVLKEA
jgi:hypothetical protein